MQLVILLCILIVPIVLTLGTIYLNNRYVTKYRSNTPASVDALRDLLEMYTAYTKVYERAVVLYNKGYLTDEPYPYSPLYYDIKELPLLTQVACDKLIEEVRVHLQTWHDRETLDTEGLTALEKQQRIVDKLIIFNNKG